MPKHMSALSSLDREELDSFYREGGLRQMASPRVHYHDANCPHGGCGHKMEWIDFQLDHKPLVRAWWDGTGFAGRCPQCGGWVHFTTLRMEPLTDDQSKRLPHLPESWHTVAQFG
jgi:hypothetical protein